MSRITLLCLLSLFTPLVSSTKVQSGLEVLKDLGYEQLADHKVLVLTNPTEITPELDLGVDVMAESGNVNLVGIMGPEHGFRGTAQAGGSTDTFTDEKTGLTVYDAYNANVDTLMGFITDSGADMVVFDIQDVGARFYTYIWAMHDTMVAAAASNTSFMVLDRPNPITGLNAFGPVLDRGYSSYVGRQPIAQSHGMTAGELAKMFAGEGWIKHEANGSEIDLKVVQVQGWKRWMTWRDTGLPWVPPSPNMPTPDTAQIYPGACMFEGTTLSEGRGTTRPFELLGAPFANASWRETMSQLGLPHTKYRFACFEPSTSKFAEHTCCGVQTYWSLDSIRAYEEFDPTYVGVALLSTAHQLYASGNDGSSNETASFNWVSSGSGDEKEYNIDLLTGGSWIRKSINQGMSPTEIKEKWTPGLQDFKAIREKYLLY